MGPAPGGDWLLAWSVHCGVWVGGSEGAALPVPQPGVILYGANGGESGESWICLPPFPNV